MKGKEEFTSQSVSRKALRADTMASAVTRDSQSCTQTWIALTMIHEIHSSGFSAENRASSLPGDITTQGVEGQMEGRKPFKPSSATWRSIINPSAVTLNTRGLEAEPRAAAISSFCPVISSFTSLCPSSRHSFVDCLG